MSLPGVATADSPYPGRLGILRNAGFLLLAYVLPRAFTFGATVVAARVLGAAGFGGYGAAAALAVAASVVATLGMMPLLIGEIARAPEQAPALLGFAHRVKTVAGAAMLAALLGAAQLLDFSPEIATAALLLGLAYAVGAYTENLGAYFQGIERMEVWTQACALQGAITGGLGAVLVVTTGDLRAFCLAPLAGQLSALGWLAAKRRRSAPHRPPEMAATRSGLFRAPAPADSQRAFLVALAPFGAAFLVMAAYYKSDVLLLSRLASPEQTGLYTAAYRFVDVAHALALVGVTAIYPRLTRSRAKAPGSVIAWTLLAATLPALTLGLARVPVMTGLFGPQYTPSSAALLPLAAMLVPLVLNIVAQYVLAAQGHVGRVAVGYAVGLAANLSLGLALVPTLGVRGSGIAKLASETVVALILVSGVSSRAR